MAITTSGQRPLVFLRVLGYFLIWVFSAAALGVLANKLFVSTSAGNLCAYTHVSYCQWGIAASAIGMVAYLLLDGLLILYLFVELPSAAVRLLELVANILALAWYLAFAIVMSVGVSDTGITSNSNLNAPPALAWICFVLIAGMVVCVLVDNWDAEEKRDDSPDDVEGPAATKAKPEPTEDI
ncbi:hypothetical protein CDCA_CDCA15G4000 [Cyanidium caldarium]|uniref:MARVEL domain-containing protein n=1 Tax=Cyanidium caldarium TaxID=2771 RepID=A0AAV9J0X4_CYACA|nr:hypothetical protein CDCA_CDCA15G4000 [Cyanidium caldarium]